jgi:hypothetical protein
MPEQDLLKQGGIDQGTIIAKMQAITKWMQKYELENGYPQEFRTKDMTYEGHCRGFSEMIIAAAKISDDIARKKEVDPEYNPKDDADTLERMYKRFGEVANAEIPNEDSSKEETKKFYQEM